MQLFLKFFLSTFSLLFLFNTSSVYSKPNFKIETLEDKSFILHLELKESFNVIVKIKDMKGLALVEEEVNDSIKFSKKYNLNLLPAGNYTLLIEDQASICRLPVALAANRLHIDFSNQKEIIKPIFQPRKNSVDVVLMLSEKTNTEMYIYDEIGHTIFSRKAKYSKSIRRRFNMSKLESGEYTISVITDGIVVREVYTIKNGEVKS